MLYVEVWVVVGGRDEEAAGDRCESDDKRDHDRRAHADEFEEGVHGGRYVTREVTDWIESPARGWIRRIRK